MNTLENHKILFIYLFLLFSISKCLKHGKNNFQAYNSKKEDLIKFNQQKHLCKKRPSSINKKGCQKKVVRSNVQPSSISSN